MKRKETKSSMEGTKLAEHGDLLHGTVHHPCKLKDDTWNP